MTEEQITVFLLEHSPPESGPIYRFLANNWDIVHQGLVAFLALIFIGLVTLAVSFYLEISE